MFETSWASSFEEAQTLIEENVYDLFIFVFFLGVNTGLTLAKEVIAKCILNPIILLTGLGYKDIDKQASDIGVYDYLVKKDIDVTSLERSIRYTILQAQIRKELKRSEMQYRSAIEHSNDIIFISDSNYLLKSLSNCVEAITNFERQDLIGTSLLDLIGAESVRHEFKEGLEKDRKIVNFPFMLKTNSKESKLSIFLAACTRMILAMHLFMGLN